MSTDSPHLYRAHGLSRNVPEPVIDAVLTRTALLRSSGVTPIVSLAHLAHQTGANYHYLRQIIERRTNPYREFEINRSEGRRPRVISSPDPVLMDVQRWLLRRVLNKVAPHSSSYAYENGKSIRDCASRHLGARWLVKMDLHNFFHGIDERMVFEVFAGLGYSRLVALELTRVCTRTAAFAAHLNPNRFKVKLRQDAEIPTYSTTLLGFVPQGAPTSGALANLVSRPMDAAMHALATEHRLVYTRYADDMVFSGAGSFDRAAAARIVRLATREIARMGFEVHKKKTRIVPPGARRIVLGLLVDGEKVRLTKDSRDRIATHVRGVEKFSLKGHQRARGFASAIGVANHINGLLAFAHDIDPAWAKPLRERWEAALRASAPALAPFEPGDILRQTSVVW